MLTSTLRKLQYLLIELLFERNKRNLNLSQKKSQTRSSIIQNPSESLTFAYAFQTQMNESPLSSDSSADEEIKSDQVYSDLDMCNPEAYAVLTSAVQAASSRCPKSQSVPSRGGVSLPRVATEGDLHCYLVELPLGLLRDLVAYISSDDFVSLALTCRKFAKLLTDKYIGYQGINFYGELQERDVLSAARLQDLARGFKFVKTYASIHPALVGLFHINPSRKGFYSVHGEEIVEGVFGSTMDVVGRRRGIAGVLCTDVRGELIACASDSIVALSSPEDLLITAQLETDHSISLKFLGDGEFIVLLRRLSLLIYSKDLQLLQKLAPKGSFLQLYIPRPEKCVFVTVSEMLDAKTLLNFSLLNGYILKDQNCASLFQRKYAQTHKSASSQTSTRTNRQIQQILMHRIPHPSNHLDFLIVLFEDGTLMVNEQSLGSGYQDVKLKEELVIGLTDTYIHIYAGNAATREFVKIGRYLCSVAGNQVPVAVEMWRTKAVIVTSEGMEWCRKYQAKLLSVSKVNFRQFQIGSVQTFEDFVLIKGKVPAHGTITTRKRYGLESSLTETMTFPQVVVANFTESCYEDRISLSADIERAFRAIVAARPTADQWVSRHIRLI